MSASKRSSRAGLVAGFCAVAAGAIGVGALALQAPATTGGSDGYVVEMCVLAATVTDSVTGEALSGVVPSIEPAPVEAAHATDARGYTSARVRPGTYRLVLSRDGYQGADREVTLFPGAWELSRVALEPLAPVVVHAGPDQARLAPGSSVGLAAKVTVRDGSRVESYRWEQVGPGPGSVRVDLDESAGAEVTLRLPGAEDYRTSLRFLLGAEGRLLDRWSVVGLTAADLAAAGRATLRLTVTTSSGVFTDEVDLYADLGSFATTNVGLRNVPVGSPVMVQGPQRRREERQEYSWSLISPQGSAAVLSDPAERTPFFVPDVPGAYELLESGERRVSIHAGTWRGAVFRQRMPTWPVWMDVRGCDCHFEGPKEAIFEDWWASGHAEIFRQVVDVSPRNGEACFACHTVGYDGANGSGGIDEGSAYATFRDDGELWDGSVPGRRLLNGPGNWKKLLVRHPDVARFGNVQCENCHGPNDSTAHETLSVNGSPARISLSSQVCATCHEDPGDESAREWWRSGHGSYGLAEAAARRSRSEPGTACARCHTAGGALAASMDPRRPPVTRDGQQHLSAAEAAALRAEADGVHPITCAVCHDPHAAGSSFRWQTEKVPTRSLAAVGATPPSAETTRADRSALCKSCHRIGDDQSPEQALLRGSAPHAPQADFLAGRNAFFVDTTKVGSHARLIEDSCIWCHMKPVPEPSPTGYPRGGVRHTFEARREDCFECHEKNDPQMILMDMDLKAFELEEVKALLEQAIRRELLGSASAELVLDGQPGKAVAATATELEALELVIYQSEIALALGNLTEPVPLRDVRLGGQPLLATARGEVLAKCAWNYFLAELDRSNGGHNPLFMQELLEGTVGALAALGGET